MEESEGFTFCKTKSGEAVGTILKNIGIKYVKIIPTVEVSNEHEGAYILLSFQMADRFRKECESNKDCED